MSKIYKIALAILLFLILASLSTWFLIQQNIPVLDPKGLIGLKEKNLLIIATLLMLIVVIPVFIMTFYFAWKYREGNKKSTYAPDWDFNLLAEIIWWGIPCLIIIALAYITWKSSYELDPFKSIDTDKKPITIQVVALPWKWLFIYPEQHIASLNYIQIPEKTPIKFEISADAPMNSFWIPQLGGQVFAMPGMKTKLHLIAHEVGSYMGCSANLSGQGFSGMNFVVKSSSKEDFSRWTQSTQQSNKLLNLDQYLQIAKPSENDPVALFALKKEDLFDWIIMKYMMPMTDMCETAMPCINCESSKQSDTPVNN